MLLSVTNTPSIVIIVIMALVAWVSVYYMVEAQKKRSFWYVILIILSIIFFLLLLLMVLKLNGANFALVQQMNGTAYFYAIFLSAITWIGAVVIIDQQQPKDPKKDKKAK